MGLANVLPSISIQHCSLTSWLEEKILQEHFWKAGAGT